MSSKIRHSGYSYNAITIGPITGKPGAMPSGILTYIFMRRPGNTRNGIYAPFSRHWSGMGPHWLVRMTHM
jgi:hypothetical protein